MVYTRSPDLNIWMCNIYSWRRWRLWRNGLKQFCHMSCPCVFASYGRSVKHTACGLNPGLRARSSGLQTLPTPTWDGGASGGAAKCPDNSHGPVPLAAPWKQAWYLSLFLQWQPSACDTGFLHTMLLGLQFCGSCLSTWLLPQEQAVELLELLHPLGCQVLEWKQQHWSSSSTLGRSPAPWLVLIAVAKCPWCQGTWLLPRFFSLGSQLDRMPHVLDPACGVHGPNSACRLVPCH